MRPSIITALILFSSSAFAADFQSNWSNMHDRVWIGEDCWANPMEDWAVRAGKLLCTRGGPNRNVHVLTHQLGRGDGDFTLSVSVKVNKTGQGSAGFRIGIQDEIDDYRARLFKGSGINAFITTNGKLILNGKAVDAPKGNGFNLKLSAKREGKGYTLTLSAGTTTVSMPNIKPERLYGNIALINNGHATGGRRPKKKQDVKGPKPLGTSALFLFSNLSISGNKVVENQKQTFGPVLWTMHTLSDSRGDDGHVLKLTAQMPPIGKQDTQSVDLEYQVDGKWKSAGSKTIESLSRTASWRIAKWDNTNATPYRVVYNHVYRHSQPKKYAYEGTIRKEPTGRPLIVAGFTGNTDSGFPNNEVTRNVAIHNPDVLFFSGDQLYEGVGGFGVIREPYDMSTLNYLRKWYMFGWAFGDLMRDRPSICLPDDHDVYQGNIWGEGGMKMPKNGSTSSTGGYRQPWQMVNAVHRTQCDHHPDFYDTTPLQQGITPFYGDMVYGRVSFAMIADRQFKSAPGHVSDWKGRPDHCKDPKYDVKKLDKPGLKLLGDRQLKFLNAWAQDWRGADLKCVLSQTIFCNLANYHGGGQQFVFADLDSNGWPQTGRNKAVDAMRRGFALNYAGDQHLPSIVHHGVDTWNDAGWSFCVPSIAAGYPRSWRPDAEGRPVQNRPKPGLPNTGEYRDAFGNSITVHAIGNPAKKNRPGRINTLHDKSSGYGIVRFDTAKQNMTMECWKLQFDAKNPKAADQFPGWPKTIHITDNYGRKAEFFLPQVTVSGLDNPVVQIINESDNTVVYTRRFKSNRLNLKTFKPGKYTLRISEPGKDKEKKLTGLKASRIEIDKSIPVKFN